MKILSSYEGKIKLVAFATNSSEDFAFQQYKGIVMAFDKGVKFVFLVRGSGVGFLENEEEKLGMELREMMQDCGRDPEDYQYQYVPANAQIANTWIQDHFLVGISDEGVTEKLIAFQDGSTLFRSAFFLSRSLALNYEEFALNLPGGNLFVIGGHLLFGADQNLIPTGDLAASFFQATQLQPFALGLDEPLRMNLASARPSRQPFYHLDLYLAPLGRRHGKMQMSVAELRDDCIHQESKPHDAWLEVRNNIRIGLESTAAQLEKQGYFIHRFPLVLNLAGSRMDVYSFHNIKVEQYGGHTKIYLPQYDGYDNPLPPSLEAMLKNCRMEWTDRLGKMGLEVKVVESSLLRTQVRFKGSLHCITKVLSRGN